MGFKSFFGFGSNKRHKEPDQADHPDQATQPVENDMVIITKEDARSIFLVGTFHPAKPNFGAVVKYDLNRLTKDETPEFECVARLNPGSVGLHHGVKSSKQNTLNKLTKDKLKKFKSVDSGINMDIHCDNIVWKACLVNSIAVCLLPVYLYNTSDAFEIEKEIPLNAYIYNIETSQIMKTFEAPEATKFSGLVFCSKEMIYCIAYPCWTNITPSPSFQRYDLRTGDVETLTPFDWDGISDEKISGYAVFESFILFNIDTRGLWAYLVKRNEWYEVAFDKQTSHSFQGLGIVIDINTLYALKECEDDSILLQLSVTIGEDIDRNVKCNVKFTASLQLEFTLPDRYCTFEARDWDKDILVHLGENKFCLVRNGLMGEGYDFQLLQLVMFTVEEQTVTVSDILEHRVEICEYSPFQPILGFSLPASHSEQIKDKQKGDLGFEITLDPLRTLKSGPRTRGSF